MYIQELNAQVELIAIIVKDLLVINKSNHLTSNSADIIAT